MATNKPDYNAYTVGWICIVIAELNAVRGYGLGYWLELVEGRLDRPILRVL